MTFERQATSKGLLTLEWDFPTWTPPERATSGTVAQAVRKALSRAEAFAAVSGKDPRPLLVLRECSSCAGSDDALLDRRLDNERTLLLARWFHCVKLPEAVLSSEHPFHALFDGEAPPHLFVSSTDGATLVPLAGDQTQSMLWKAMTTLMKQAYKGDPDRAVKNLLKLMAQFDHLDSMELELAARLEQESERRGPEAPRVKTLRQDLEKIRQEKAKALERERELRDLQAVASDD